MKNRSFIKLFTSETLSDAFFLSNIREIWKTYQLKKPEELKLFIEKEKDLVYQMEQFKFTALAKENLHNGYILHKKDVHKVDDKHMFEIQGDRRMKYMNVFFSVSQEFIAKIKNEINTRDKSGDRISMNISMGNDSLHKISMSVDTFKNKDLTQVENVREIVRIKAERKKDLLDETFVSNRDKLVRLNRSKQDVRGTFVSPENRLGTQLNPIRNPKIDLIVKQQFEDIKIRPETEKAHKRILSSGMSMSKQSTGLPSKALRGFGISGRTVYGKNTPLIFSNLSGAHTPANEYEENSKMFMMMKSNKIKEEFERRARIAKAREIEKIMRRLGKAEQQRNVEIFKNLIKEEKLLHKELVELDKTQRHREIMSKKHMIFRDNKRKSFAKIERDFALTFAQHKNIIAKHASLGEKRRRENEYLDNSINKHISSKIKTTLILF